MQKEKKNILFEDYTFSWARCRFYDKPVDTDLRANLIKLLWVLIIFKRNKLVPLTPTNLCGYCKFSYA
jgi:hypothetical protein